MLKKILIILSFAVIGSLPLVVKAEEIKSFAVTAKIQDNASVQISEKIVYDFGTEEKHGIFRNIPYKYKIAAGNFTLRFDDISVTDEQGNKIKFDTSKKGLDIIIKVGDKNKTITGINTYIINYTVKNAITYFADEDEFYWNVTGNDWGVDRSNISATVFLPGNPPTSSIKAACYAGVYGDDTPCAEKIIGNPTYFNQPQLTPGRGLTIAVSFPKGLLRQPTQQEKTMAFIRDNIILLLPIVVFLILLWLWRKNGKDARGNNVVVAQFDAPDNLTPLEVGTIVDEMANNKDISGEIINLAVRGYLKVNRIETKGLLHTKEDYQFVQLKPAKDLETEHEKILMSALFDSKPDDMKKSPVALSSFGEDGKVFEKIQKLTSMVNDGVVTKGYFKANPHSIRTGYKFVGALVIIAGIFLSQFFIYSKFIAFISFCLSGILIIIFSRFMPAKTEKGRIAGEHILGLKKYLEVAEKARLEFHNAPEKNPEQFEKLLPFAMVLGVEEKWAKQFEGIYVNPPAWYGGNAPGTFNSLVLIHSVANLRSGVSSTFASNRSSNATGTSAYSGRSAAGGGRGSGGGGFSGGGFGGGGGGSW